MRHMMAGDNNLYIVTKNIPAKSDSFNYFEIVLKLSFPLSLHVNYSLTHNISTYSKITKITSPYQDSLTLNIESIVQLCDINNKNSE